MAVVVFEDTALVEIVTASPNATMVNTLYVKGTNPWNLVTLEGLAVLVWDWWATDIAPMVSDAVDLVKVRARDMAAQNSWVFEYTDTTPVDGNVSAGILPGNATMTVKFGTGLSGRAKRGRNYVIGLTEDQVAGDDVAPATVSAYVAAYENLQTLLVAEGFAHVVASRANCTDPETPCQGETYTVINYSSDGVVDSQRRRLAGRGA